MKEIMQFLMLTMFCFNNSFGQNYLYQKEMSGMSGYVNVLTQAKKDLTPGFSFGADYTFDGTASLGIRRSQLKSKTVYDDSDTGFFTFNFSVTPLKVKWNKTTLSLPLVGELNIYDKQQFLSYGIRLAAMTELAKSAYFIPTLSVHREPSFTHEGSNHINIIFESNFVFNALKFAPMISVFDEKIRFGLSVGFAVSKIADEDDE
jgi:hypothetical protein